MEKKLFFGRRGQMVAVDIILMFVAIVIFAVVVLSFSTNLKSQQTQSLRATNDFAKSMLLSLLYSTPDNSDPRLMGKNMADLFAMHMANPDAVTEDFLIDELRKSHTLKYLADRQGGKMLWSIQAETGSNVNLGALSSKKKTICFIVQGDAVKKCSGEVIYASRSPAGSAKISFPGKTSLGTNAFEETTVYLTIAWETS